MLASMMVQLEAEDKELQEIDEIAKRRK